ncbi:MAG: ATP-binding protein [Myxococcota bacterium]
MLGFRGKLLLSYLGLVLAVSAISLLILSSTLGQDLMHQLDQRLIAQAEGAAKWVSLRRAEHGGADQGYDRQASRLKGVIGSWVTIIDAEGRVVGDSDLPGGAFEEEPARCPEVTAARAGEVGRATRWSDHFGAEAYFVAVPAGPGGLVRIGVPLSEIRETQQRMRARLYGAAVLAFFAAVGLGLFASAFFMRPLSAMIRAAESMARGRYDVRIESPGPDEFGTLARTLNLLATELSTTISALVEERDRLSAILSSMVEGVIVTNERQEIVLANPSARRLLAAESLEQKPITAILPPSEEAVRELEIGARWLLLTTVRLRAQDRAVGEVLVLHDVTERRRLDAMQREFVANVSHELRTPVASIQGYSETLLGRPLDPGTTREFLEVIHRQAERMGRLVQDLLRLAELEARQEQAPLSPVPVAVVTRRVLETVKKRAEARGVELRDETEAGALALARADDLEQVLENLVDNAIKYGGPRVSIRSRIDQGRLEIRVEDAGPGIPAEHLPRLFERFYRVDRHRSKESGGTGLGLAIVERLVRGMRGQVRAESALGQGSSFIILLDRAP